MQPPEVRREERLHFTLVNTGPTCVTFGAEFRFERRTASGSWEPTGPRMDFLAYAGHLQPGQSFSDSAQIPAELEPGRHRVVKDVGTSDGPLTVHAEFEVVQ